MLLFYRAFNNNKQREMEEKQMKSSTLSDDKKRAREDQQRKSDLLTEEMRKATEEMYSTMERMKELRKQCVLCICRPI